MADVNSGLDFLIIGVGKSGTTALADYISMHPDIILTEPKEPWFFDTIDFQKGMSWYWSEYLKNYAGERYAGEASSHTLFVPYAAKRIKERLPDAKLIALLRNPVERAYSDWWMKYCSGKEKDDFGAAIEKNFRQIESGVDFSDPAIWQQQIDSHQGCITYKTYIDYGYYATQLKRYFDCFSKEQIMILLSDDLFHHHTETIEKVWRFLGVDPNFGDIALKPRHKNVAKSPLAAAIRKSFNRLPLSKSIKESIPESAKDLLLSAINSIDTGKKPEIPLDVQYKLQNYYKEEIKRLENMIDRDLSAWL